MIDPPDLPEELSYADLYQHVVAQSQKNRLPDMTFLGDGLPHYRVPDLVPFVAGLRELMTAYTPYQPERSQGTLMTQWLYQCCLAMLTGFEAINASQYDRATALVEALYTAARLLRQGRTHFLLLGSLWPQDLEVVQHPAGRHTADLRGDPPRPSAWDSTARDAGHRQWPRLIGWRASPSRRSIVWGVWKTLMGLQIWRTTLAPGLLSSRTRCCWLPVVSKPQARSGRRGREQIFSSGGAASRHSAALWGSRAGGLWCSLQCSAPARHSLGAGALRR